MRIGMFSWESLYSIKVGGVAPHVSELSEALAEGGTSYISSRGEGILSHTIGSTASTTRELIPTAPATSLPRWIGCVMLSMIVSVQ